MADFRYKITIEPTDEKTRKNWGEDYRYSVSLSKLYGDRTGRASCFKTKEDVVKAFRAIRKEWESYDSILGRQSDRLTWDNLLFESKVKEITKENLFGQANLF